MVIELASHSGSLVLFCCPLIQFSSLSQKEAEEKDENVWCGEKNNFNVKYHECFSPLEVIRICQCQLQGLYEPEIQMMECQPNTLKGIES